MDAPLPASPPEPTLVDKVDVTPTLTEGLGENSAGAVQGAVHVLYVDRQREDKRVLKWATWAGGPRWSIDVLEPPGIPLAVLPGPSGGATALWAADGMLLSAASGTVSPSIVRVPFSTAGGASSAAGGLTVYDTGSRALVWLAPDPAGWSQVEVPGGREVHCAAPAPAGGLAVATYVPERHRIMLFESGRDRRWKSTAVTSSDDTRFVYLAPFEGRYLFLYDGVEGVRSGGRVSTLSLLVPDGRRYSRKILWQGERPLAGAAARLSGRTLYVLWAGESVTLLRTVLR